MAKKKSAPKRPAPTEHAEQTALMHWWRAACRTIDGYTPDVLLFAIPNGGDRHPAVAAKLRAEGVLPGVPDLFLAASRGGASGLWIEMKRVGGRVSPDQTAVHSKLANEGFAVAVAFGWVQASIAVRSFLGGDIGPGLCASFKDNK